MFALLKTKNKSQTKNQLENRQFFVMKAAGALR